VDKNLLHPSFAGLGKPKSAPGQEKFTFIYVAGSGVAVTCAVAYSLMAGLVWWHSLLLLIGCLLAAWALVFTFMEVRRIAGAAKTNADETLSKDADLYVSRTVTVSPPTGEAYPHHEYYAESAGLDQGQLTSQLPGSTPFIEKFLSRRSDKEKA
jgi:hypothetical protein